MNSYESDGHSEDLENNWKDEEVFTLIQLWQDHLVELSKPRRSLNTCKIISEGLQEITKRNVPRTAKDVQEKVTNLRRQYNANKKKYELMGKRSPWRFYKAIHKFRENMPIKDVASRKQSSTFDKIDPGDFLHTSLISVDSETSEYVNGGYDEASMLNIKRCKTEREESDEDDNVRSTVECIGKYSDEFSAFADNVAWSLRNIKDRTTICLAKYKINTILFEAEMGLLCLENSNISDRGNSNEDSKPI